MVRRWSEESVRAGLVAEYRLAPEAPVLSPMRGPITRPDGSVNFIAAAYAFLGRDRTPEARELRRIVLTWAWTKAAGNQETSRAAVCRANGWSPRSFERRCNAGIRTLADQLDAHANALDNAATRKPR
jgi:hypothetical protein